MDRREIIGFAVFTMLFVFAIRAPAETKSDEGLWLMLASQGSFGAANDNQANEKQRDLRWWLDIQPRFADKADGLGQTLIRPGVGISLTDNATAWVGYAWILTKRRGQGHSEEHRSWQQLSWSAKFSPVNFASRTRLEQRKLDTGNDLGWRLRQFVKGTLPLAANGRFFLSAYDEIFVDLNGTDWGQRTGVSQNRFFVGLGWKFGIQPFAGRLRSEVGYLNQFIPRRVNADRINHILSINFFLNF